MGRSAILEKYRERVRVVMRKKGRALARLDNFAIEHAALTFILKVGDKGPKKEYLLEPFAARYAPMHAQHALSKNASRRD